MTPPINIDGRNENYSNVTIDGQDVTQITIDGQDVLSTIPDSGLQHRYDATEITASDGDSVTTLPDVEGADDLTGSATFQTSGIGQNASLDLNGSTDLFDGAFGSVISAPYDIFVVISPDSTSGFQAIHDGASNRVQLGIKDGAYQIAPANTSGGSATTGAQILLYKARSSSITLEKEDSEEVSNANAANNLDGLTLFARLEEDSNLNGQFGEAGVWDPSASGYSESDVWSYLSNKWGVTV